MLMYEQTVCYPMDEQIPMSTPPEMPRQPALTPEQLEQIKALARERAIKATFEAQGAPDVQVQPSYQPYRPPVQPEIVYLRRNLTVAEILVLLAISCGLVFGVQNAWNFASNVLPRIEVKVK